MIRTQRGKEFLILTLVGLAPHVYLLFALPLTWNYIDSIVMATMPPWHEGVLLHYPPLYPYLLRQILSMTQSLTQEHNPADVQWADVTGYFTTAGIYTIVILQHFFFLTAVLYTAEAVGKNLWRKIIFVFCLQANFFVLLFIHGLFSEAVWIIWMLFQLGAVLNLCKPEATRLHYVVFAVAFFLSLMTRHLGILLAPVLPLAFLLYRLNNRTAKTDQPIYRDLTFLKKLGFSLLVVISVIGLQKSVHEMILTKYGIVYRNTLSRVTPHRFIAIDWKNIGEDKKEEAILAVQSKTDNPMIQQSVPIVFETQSPGFGTYQDVLGLLSTEFKEEISKERAVVLADQIINEIYWLFLKTGNPYLFSSIFSDWKKFFYFTTGDRAKSILLDSIDSLKYYKASVEIRPLFANPGDIGEGQIKKLSKALNSFWIKLLSTLNESILMGLIISLACLGAFRGHVDRFLAWFIGLCGLFYFSYLLLIASLTVCLVRYAAPASLAVYFALGLLVSSWKISPRRKDVNLGVCKLSGTSKEMKGACQ